MGEPLKQYNLTPMELDEEETRKVIPLRLEDLAQYENILLIEDEEVERKMMERKLKKYCSNILSFESVELAKDYLLTHRSLDIDVLICDYWLPGEVGTSIAKLLKQRNPQTKTFLVSGDIEASSKDKNIQYIDEKMAKPLHLKLLEENLK